jgi:putative two-component system response regulator
MQILVVDDDEIAIEALRSVLTEAGHEVEAAHDGVEALEMLRLGSCRLVISDWVMPRMDGPELCRRIRSEDFPGYVYVILLTSRDGLHDVVEGLTAGADDFITKPFHPEELRVRVRAGERILSLETRDMAIFAMAKLAESRDPETGTHLERVRNYARIIAARLGARNELHRQIDAEFIRLIYLTSPLHDIGKVGLPDTVLLKPGRLSDREFEIMKTHTTIGAETLGAALRQFPSARFLHMARDIALTHHERWDGTGYPNGLAAEDIPLCGRIVALADVYDALTSKRSYKQAYPHDIARSILLKESGSHFDGRIVNAFVDGEEEFLEVHERYAESECVAV